MSNDDVGNRTGQWFWGMITSLGLQGMNDSNFDMYKVNNILNTFLERKYLPNGRGGLFTLEHPDRDLRNVEIWYQMHRYLGEIL